MNAGSYWPEGREPDLLDRRMAAEKLQSYSDYGGWEASFAVGGEAGKTLRMTGCLLCAEDFPRLIPGPARRLMVDAGFERFECQLPGDARRIEVAVKP